MNDTRIFVDIIFKEKHFKIDGLLNDSFIELNLPNGDQEFINVLYPLFSKQLICFTYEGNKILLENIRTISKNTRFNANLTVDTIRYSYENKIINPSQDNLYKKIIFKIDKANLIFKLKSFDTRFCEENKEYLGG